MSDTRTVEPSTKAVAGAYSLAEILSQPEFWGRCLEALQRQGSLAETRQPFRSAREWLFVGCGSSYYIALSAAAAWSSITGMRARAIPASELLLFPEIVLAGSENLAAVVISRSGRTSEAVRAAQVLEREKNIRVLAVTGTPGQPLEQTATATLPLLPCDEQSTVMTRSFTSMLIGLQYLAACEANNSALLNSFSKLPGLAQKAMNSSAAASPRIHCGAAVCRLRVSGPGTVLWPGLRDRAQGQRDVGFLRAELSYSGIPPWTQVDCWT